MTRDPWLLYGAEIRKRILDEVAAEIARLAARRKVGRLVSVGIGDADHGAAALLQTLSGKFAVLEDVQGVVFQNP